IGDELLDGKEGETVTLGDVLRVHGKVGTPMESGASAKATVLNHKKGDKVIVFEKKRRQDYNRKYAHRQHTTVRNIDDIARKRAGNGPEESRRKHQDRPRFSRPAAWREGIRQPADFTRRHHRAPARHEIPSRQVRGPWQGPHDLRQEGRR